MKRYIRVIKNGSFPLVTLTVLFALALGYYLFYVRGQEVYFTHRYLRLLTFESEQIEERLGTLDKIFANYKNDVTPTDTEIKNLMEELRVMPKIERVDPPPNFVVADKGITREGRIEGDRFWVYTGWKDGDRPGNAKSGEDAVFRFDPFALNHFSLAKPGLRHGFETLFVARRDGTVLYQKDQDGSPLLRIVSLKGLLGKDGKEVDFATLTRSTSNLEVRLGGDSYRLFLRPCCRTIWEADRGAPTAAGEGAQPQAQAAAKQEKPAPGSSLEWIVGGVVRSSTFSAQCWSISFTLGMTVVSLLILALLGLCFLRVLAIGPHEKLRVADALWVGFTAIVGAGLLTLLLVDLHSYRSHIEQTDVQLKDLAIEIQANMTAELTAAWEQLGKFNKEVKRRLAKLDGTFLTITTCQDVMKAGLQEHEPKHIPYSYLDFERFTWVDPQGKQCFKWSLDDAKDPLVQDVRARNYFKEAREDRPGIDPVFSWSSGRRVAALSQPVNLSPQKKQEQRFVSVLGIEMSSLNRPVLPAGYGFAVIAEDGDVLFHSERGRAGYENFFEEADNDRTLRSLVFARRSGSEDASYLGQGHRLFVMPIQPPGPPAEESIRNPPFWTLIVFSDKSAMRSFNVDSMSTAMLLLVLYLFVYMAAGWLLRAVNRRYRAGWLWPERKGEKREKAHLALTGFYVLCLIAFLAALQQLAGVELLWFAFVFPWAVLLVSYRICATGMSKRRQALVGAALAGVLLLLHLTTGDRGVFDLTAGLTAEWRFVSTISLGLWLCFFLAPWVQRLEVHPPRWLYLAAASLLLALTAACPAAAFFCVARRAHLETHIQRVQLELARDKEARDWRLQRRYNAVERKTSSDPLVMKKIGDRMKKGETWDLYHHFLFDTRFDESLPATTSSALQPARVATAKLGAVIPPTTEEPAEKKLCTLLPGFIQHILPLYTEDFIRVRWLIHEAGKDDFKNRTFDWNHSVDGKLTLRRASLRLTSSIPPFSLAGFRLLWPVSLLLLLVTLIGVTRFIAVRFFLFGLPAPEAGEPLSIAAASTRSLILVSPRIDEMAERFAGQGMALIDLRELGSRDDLLRCLERQELIASPRIYLHHFEHRLQDEEHNLLKLDLMEELILGRDRPVIVLSHVVPTWYLLDRKPLSPAEDATLDPDKAAKRLEAAEKARKEVQERWRGLLRRFLTWEWRNRANINRLDSDLGLLREEQVQLQGGRNGRRLERLLAAAREECDESEQLEGLAGNLVRARLQDLSRDLFFDDLRDRAEPYYRTLWAMCTEAEKVVLVHLAEGGLVNGKNAGALKMLMRRGLVQRDPYFRLMNESFRRFVASDVCLDEVRTLERQAEASIWNRMRGPVLVTLIGVCAFFFITQREVFDVSMAFFGAVAASLPSLLRVVGTLAPGKSREAA